MPGPPLGNQELHPLGHRRARRLVLVDRLQGPADHKGWPLGPDQADHKGLPQGPDQVDRKGPDQVGRKEPDQVDRKGRPQGPAGTETLLGQEDTVILLGQEDMVILLGQAGTEIHLERVGMMLGNRGMPPVLEGREIDLRGDRAKLLGWEGKVRPQALGGRGKHQVLEGRGYQALEGTLGRANPDRSPCLSCRPGSSSLISFQLDNTG